MSDVIMFVLHFCISDLEHRIARLRTDTCCISRLCRRRPVMVEGCISLLFSGLCMTIYVL